MANLLHQVTIEAAPKKVFDALTTEKGLKGWWTKYVTARPQRGSVAKFGFGDPTPVFHMTIEDLVPGKRLRWKCRSKFKEWNGTRLRFDLKRTRAGATVVDFTHAGWRSVRGDYRLCNTHWGHLMVRLKTYVESEKPGPFFD